MGVLDGGEWMMVDPLGRLHSQYITSHGRAHKHKRGPWTVSPERISDSSHCMRRGDFVARQAASNLCKLKTIQTHCFPPQFVLSGPSYNTFPRVVNARTRRMSSSQGNFSHLAPNGLQDGPLALSGKSPLRVKNSLSKERVFDRVVSH